MQVCIEKSYSELSKKAAKIIGEAIKMKPNIVLGLATGNTPLGTYKELIRMHKEEGLDFSKVITFNLDEYYDISPQNPQSYHYYMYNNFFKHININYDNIYIPNGKSENIEKHCKNYDKEIMKYSGIDLQLLGIGENGHIGFNEPGSELIVTTHLTQLSESTIKANSRFFKSIEDVPRKAITMGLGSIMKANKIVLLANGYNKADVIAELLLGKKTSTKIPASTLLLHKNTTVIVDEEAASIYNKRKKYKKEILNK